MTSRFIDSRQVRMEPADRTLKLAQYLAYNGRCAVHIGADGKRFDYRKKTGYVVGGTVYPRSLQASQPERVPMWETLQALAPDNMKVIATALIATLPRGDELSQAERVALIGEFCEPIVDEGHIIDWNMHRGRNGNWHVHFLVSASGMFPDKRRKPLANSPFRLSAYKPEETEEACNDQTKHSDKGKKTEIINPPWQRLWRVAQERFFKRRGIDLRVPASTMVIRDKNDQQRTVLPPAAVPGGYASRNDIADWRAKRRETFSDPSLYVAALTRDRLLIDQGDIDTFNAMIWTENAPPEQIRRAFGSAQANHPLTMERVGNGGAIRFGNGTFSSHKNVALLYRAMRAARSLDYAPFIDQMELADDIGSNFVCIACTESIGMVSAAKPEHLLPIKRHKFQPKGLIPIIDRAARYVEPIFISADHISYCRYAKALKKKDWAVIGISELLSKKSLANCSAYKRGLNRDLTRGVMLIVLDAQRISEPRLATLVCVAEKLQRELGRLRLLLMKPDDIMGEQTTPIMDWLSRSMRHFHCPDPDQCLDPGQRTQLALKKQKPWEVEPALRRNTFATRFPGGTDAPFEKDLAFDNLPSEFTRAGISRHERYKAIVTRLAPGNEQSAKPQSQRHPLIVVASRPGMNAEGSVPGSNAVRAGGVTQVPGIAALADLQRLRPDDKVLITTDLPDQALSAGTVLTILDVNAEKGVFWYTHLDSDAPYSVPADLASHFLPLDIVTLRDAFVVMAHAERIRQQLDIEVHVIVSEPKDAMALLSFAESLDRERRRVIIDKCLCTSPDQLIAVIDKSAFRETLDALSDVIDTKPRIRALYGSHPDAYDMYEALGVFDGADVPLEADALHHAPVVRPEEQQVQPDADFYDNPLDFDAMAEGVLYNENEDREYDPDIALPEFWNDDPGNEPDDDTDFDYEDDPDPDR